MLTALSLAAALAAQSQTPPPPPPQPQVRTERHVMVLGGHGGEGPGSLDKDGDGQLNREEFTAPMTDVFTRFDTNGDGRLSDEELKAGHGGPDGEGNFTFMRHPGPGGPGGPGGDHRVFMRHPGGPESAPGMHRFEVRRENVNGEETVRVFTRGENGEMTEVEGGLEGLDLPEGAHVRMLPGGGDRDVTIIARGGPGGEMMRHPMPGGDGRVMVFEMADGEPGEHRVEVRRMGPGGHDGPGAPHVEIHRMGGPDGHGPGDMDKDGDGRVTEDEFLAPLREAFQRMDADHSGALEAAEHGGDRRVHVITRSEERRSAE